MNRSNYYKIRQILALRFPWVKSVAHEFLEHTLINISDDSYRCYADIDTGHLLESIIYRQVKESGCKKIVIPLSAGYDSRGILAASFHVFDKNRIHCISVGDRSFKEVKIAQRICKNNGVKWSRIDPNNDVQWSLDQLVEMAFAVYKKTHGYMDHAWGMVANALEGMINDDTIVISGFLGDSVTGEKVNINDQVAHFEDVLNSFFEKNKTPLSDEIDWGYSEVRSSARNFLSSNWSK